MENAELCPRCGGGKTIARRAKDGTFENTFAAFYCTCSSDKDETLRVFEVFKEVIRKAEAEGWKRGMEEAAKIVEDIEKNAPNGHYLMNPIDVSKWIVAALRAAIEKKEKA